ncbi:hypothetical protein COT72_00720 [archaeon CG10_big_fil_rev_8_21_14_0_10_43_11]|nr:MAG: hypothetical protein COT72_00720 [archaeon CG10_big_fil_rev_8_21_14_0_10_43_11]
MVTNITSLPIVEPLTLIINWLVQSTATAVPLLLSASIILLLGWITAVIVEKVIMRVLLEIKLDTWEKKYRIDKALYGLRLVTIISQAIKWYVLLVFLSEAAKVLSLEFIAGMLQRVLSSLQEWVLGGAMIGAALIIGHRVQEKIEESNMLFGAIGSRIVYFVILYFALVLALPKFGFVNTEILVETFKFLAAGLSVGLAIAVGIAFGNALREPVKKVVDDMLRPPNN